MVIDCKLARGTVYRVKRCLKIESLRRTFQERAAEEEPGEEPLKRQEGRLPS